MVFSHGWPLKLGRLRGSDDFSGVPRLSVHRARSSRPRPLESAVAVNRQELSMPPTISVAQARGFGLFMLQAVMNGPGDELIDLARTISGADRVLQSLSTHAANGLRNQPSSFRVGASTMRSNTQEFKTRYSSHNEQ